MSSTKNISVITRKGKKQPFYPDKIREKLKKLSYNLYSDINLEIVTAKVVSGIYDGIKTEELDNLSAETCAYMNIVHPDYLKLASRIVISNLHKNTGDNFYELLKGLNTCMDDQGRETKLINDDIIRVMDNEENRKRIQNAIKYERDLNFDFFGIKTLEKNYLLKIQGKIVERPQHMLMRVSLGIHYDDIDSAIETYNIMSEQWFIHETPTLYNAGTMFPQLSSYFSLTLKSDSIDEIYNTLKQTAVISKYDGVVGLSVHNIRTIRSYIKGDRVSNGLIPMLKVYNATARYFNQIEDNEKRSFAVYIEPWHVDIFEFLQLKRNYGNEENRTRDLYCAIWINDLFMQRVADNADWTLMCPNECPELSNYYGEEFEKLYIEYEKLNKGRKTIKAKKLWATIIDSQIETGTPYISYKDSCNRKSNQKNLGTIKSSNLCTEIVEYSSPDEVAVCNSASISLSKFVNKTGEFDYEHLGKITKILTKNLNKVIDSTYYPVKEAKNSNFKHRPIGLGVQGLADTFCKLKISFESPEAKEVNEKIFETIYYNALVASVELAERDGPYSSFEGSPISKGLFQFDLWNTKPTDRYNWDALKEKIKKNGIRNSLLVALSPKTLTSQILGNNEGFDPFKSNIYTKRASSKEFVVMNKYLELWTSEIKTQIITNNGSIQKIEIIPDHIKKLYKTVWEISQELIINMAITRGKYICQSQSLDIHLSNPVYLELNSIHFFTWKNGLKTGMRYLRSSPEFNTIGFTLVIEEWLKAFEQNDEERFLREFDKIVCIYNNIYKKERTPLTDDEKKYINENKNGMSLREMSTNLNKSFRTIHEYISKCKNGFKMKLKTEFKESNIKSRCCKEYCECYKNRIPCNIKCRCKDCNNSCGVAPDVAKKEVLSCKNLENIKKFDSIDNCENNYCEFLEIEKYRINQNFSEENSGIFLNKKRKNEKNKIN